MPGENKMKKNTVACENQGIRSRLTFYTLLVALVWTIVLGGALAININDVRRDTKNLAFSKAMAHFDKDQALRLWATKHGGVYVPISKETPANPHLAHFFERDIKTPSGKDLTLMNPAYVIRQLNESFKNLYGVAGHITSLNPLRPENKPDEWERTALLAFETGINEVSQFTTIHGAPYLRLMRPMTTTQECLKCHEHQGYKEGDIRGGVSLSVPLSLLVNTERDRIGILVQTYAVLWVLGLAGLGFGWHRIRKSDDNRNVAVAALRHAYDRLESEVDKRTKQLSKTNDELQLEIIDHRQAKEALEQSQARLSSIFSAAPIGIGLTTKRLFKEVNDRICSMLGYSREELIGKSARIVYPSDEEFETVGKEKYAQIRERGTGTVETQWKRKDGTVLDVLLSSTSLDPSDLTADVTFTALDITDRKKAEVALKESEEKYRTVLEGSPDPVVVYDMVGKVVYLNPAFTDIFGWSLEELLDKNTVYVPEENWPETKKMIDNVLAGKSFSGIETRRLTKDGQLLDVSLSAAIYRDRNGTPVGSVINLRDITKHKKLEAQLQQAQKMKSLGTLAGGIAHDFNNLLMAIQWNVSLLYKDIDTTHPRYKTLKNIEGRIESGSKLTTQLLGYARKGKYEVKPIDLNELVEGTAETFGRARKDITIHQQLANDLKATLADQGQLEQLLLNLFINAAEAMPSGGTLVLKTANVTHENLGSRVYNIKPGNYVELTISDTGTGIDKATIERIFEPFFTTKETGKGTGLGLASVYGIVKSHGGYIDVESEQGHGATFHIYLLATEEKAQRIVETSKRTIQRNWTILLVDDEEMVREVGSEVLKGSGYSVLEAESGSEAVRAYREHKDEIDLVILDIVMPDMGGGEVYDRIKQMNPHAKVLLSSGYSIEGQATDILERGCDGFIQKPFRMQDLFKKIGEILDTHERSGSNLYS